MSLAHLGRFAEAADHAAESIRIAEQTHHAFSRGWAHATAGTLHLVKGDRAKARASLERGLVVIGTENIVPLLASAVASSSWGLAQLGETTEASSRLEDGEQCLQLVVARGFAGYVGSLYHAVGRAAMLLGQFDEARRLAHRAVETSSRQPSFLAAALSLLGDLAAHPGGLDAKRADMRHRSALSLAEPLGMRPLVAHCHLGLGRLQRRVGKREQARRELATATAMYREMDMRFWLAQAEMATNERA
jgi:tetratricopeptide (TPR) repeat protein